MTQYLVILHGLKKSSKHMARLAKFAKMQNHQVILIDYESTKFSIEELVNHVEKQIKILCPNANKINFIGYSLGGVLTLLLLQRKIIHNVGRIILIGCPVKGSKIADFFGGFNLFKKIFGIAGTQLAEKKMQQRNLKNLKYDAEIATISGVSRLNFLAQLIFAFRKNDGSVELENSFVECSKDKLTIKAGHFFLPFNKIVIYETLHFLKFGNFSRIKKIELFGKKFKEKLNSL